jgi:hypothetical protein
MFYCLGFIFCHGFFSLYFSIFFLFFFWGVECQVYNIARSNRDDRFNKLIDIASTSTFREGTRLSALIELYFELESNTTADKSDIKIRLEQLSKDILSSPNDFKDERYQNLLNDEVLQIINLLKGF